MSVELIFGLLGTGISIAGTFVAIYSTIQTLRNRDKLKQIEEEKLMSHIDIKLETSKLEIQENGEKQNYLIGNVILSNKGTVNSFIEKLVVTLESPDEGKYGLGLPEDVEKVNNYEALLRKELVSFNEIWARIFKKDLDIQTRWETGSEKGVELIREEGVSWMFKFELSLEAIITKLFKELFFQLEIWDDTLIPDLEQGIKEEVENIYDDLRDYTWSIGRDLASLFGAQFFGIFAGQDKRFFTKIPFFKSEWASIAVELRSIRAEKVRTEELEKFVDALEYRFSDLFLFLLTHLYFHHKKETFDLMEGLGKTISIISSTRTYWEQRIDNFDLFDSEFLKAKTNLINKIEETPNLSQTSKHILTSELNGISNYLLDKKEGLLQTIQNLFNERGNMLGEKESDVNIETYEIFLSRNY